MGIADKKIMDWHTEVLPKKTLRALEYCSKQSWLRKQGWYLAGGTALALYAGHRASQDLDFFLPKTFREELLIAHFANTNWKTTHRQEWTVYGDLFGAKVSFIAHPSFSPLQPGEYFGTVRVLDPRDIAVMKVMAISDRGTKRDFIDLYWYCKHTEPLIELLTRVHLQYSQAVNINYNHIIRSLIYFKDAMDDPMPQMHVPITWSQAMNFFQSEAPRLAKHFLNVA